MEQERLAPEYNGWFGDHMDSWYEGLLDEATGPFRPAQILLESFPDVRAKPVGEITLLDAACGTGNIYIAYSKRGYEVWATDGSWKMLRHAVSNCKEEGQQDSRIVPEPISWADTDAYRRHFVDKGIAFDVILLMSNSLCHVPAVTGQLDVAIQNFAMLLKPGGRLIIDTKRFSEPDFSQGPPICRELQNIAGRWVVRDVREDGTRTLDGWGEVDIRTKMHYEIESRFNICRAKVEVTFTGPQIGSRVEWLTYYPLPAHTLVDWLSATGTFECVLHAAKEPPLAWSYDVVVATKV